MSYFFIVTDPLFGDRGTEVVYEAADRSSDFVDDEVSALGAYDHECRLNDVELDDDKKFEVYEVVNDQAGAALIKITQHGDNREEQLTLLQAICERPEVVSVAQGRVARDLLRSE